MFGHRHGYRHYITPKLHEPQIKQNTARTTWLRTGNGEQIPIKPSISGKVIGEGALVMTRGKML